MALRLYTDREFLGDGIQASWDGYRIRLRRVGPHGTIIQIDLEPEVMAALSAYAKRRFIDEVRKGNTDV